MSAEREHELGRRVLEARDRVLMAAIDEAVRDGYRGKLYSWIRVSGSVEQALLGGAFNFEATAGRKPPGDDVPLLGDVLMVELDDARAATWKEHTKGTP